MKRTLLLLCLLGSAWHLIAQESSQPLRPVYSAYSLEFGTAHLADTYLTPLKYSGSHFGFQYERSQAMKFNPDNWLQQLAIGANVDLTKNPAKNATMASIDISLSWRMLHRWQMPWLLTVGLGPGLSVNGGCQYLSRNGNNPASAKASATVEACGYASRPLRIGRLSSTLRYQTALPVAGAFFSPNYGQLYYQIYLGDTQKLAHMAWWGNYFCWDNQVTADLHFGATTLRLGYRGKLFSTKVNHIVSHQFTHALVIGVCTDWISLRPGHKLPDARIISAY